MILEPFFFAVVAFYVLLAVGLGATLYLLITLNAGIARLRAECDNKTSGLKAVLRLAATERANLRRELDRVESTTGASSQAWLVAGNLSRDKILRLHEQGENPTAIAQTLGLPDGQVKLMLKVQRMVGETR
jgi:hypothetical protein